MNRELQKVRERRQKRAWRVRKRMHGTRQKPRLSVHKTNKHIQVQLIDDDLGVTLAGIATYSKEFANTEHATKSKTSAKKLGERIAELAKEHQVREVIFDRGPFKYHGILAEIADAARAGGLEF